MMNQWVTFDTGREIELSRVRLIKRRSGGFRDAEWLGARQGGGHDHGGHDKWQVLKSFRMPHDCMLYDVTMSPAHVRGRFWKLLILNFHPDVDKKQPDLSEIKFFGRLASPTPAPLPTPASTLAPTPTARHRCPCVYEDGTVRSGPEISVHRVQSKEQCCAAYPKPTVRGLGVSALGARTQGTRACAHGTTAPTVT